jgi:hypothetical protein
VFLPGLCSRTVLRTLLDSGKIDLFSNEAMKNSIQAAWNLFGRRWFLREALKRASLLLLCGVYSYLLALETASAPQHSLDGGCNPQGGFSLAGLLSLWQSAPSAKALLVLDACVLVACVAEVAHGWPGSSGTAAAPSNLARVSKSSRSASAGSGGGGGGGVRPWCRAAKAGRRTRPSCAGAAQSCLSRLRRFCTDVGTDTDVVKLVTMLLCAATCVAHVLRYSKVSSVAAIAALSVWSTIEFTFRGLRSSGQLMHMLEHIAVEIGAFIVILFCVIAAYSHVFLLLFATVPSPEQAAACVGMQVGGARSTGGAQDGGGNQSELLPQSQERLHLLREQADVGVNGQSFSTFGSSFMTVFQMMLGEVGSISESQLAQDETLVQIVFVTFIFLCTVVLLNLLIAVVADKYVAVA